MPIQSQRIPMSYETWQLLPYQPGWEYEYIDGCAHMTPSHQVAITQVVLSPRPESVPDILRLVVPADEAALLSVYMEAFEDNQAFCDHTETQFLEAARNDLYDSFRVRPLLEASRVAVDTRGAAPHLIGAALLSRDAGYGPVLDLIFVRPAWHHQGVATALVSEAINALVREGEQTLTSCYQLANIASQKWHQGLGFVELPDMRYAQAYLRRAQQEVYRCEQLGKTDSEAYTRWRADVSYWCDQVAILERMDDEQGFWAVYPRIPHW